MRRGHLACLALVGVIVLLALRGVDLPGWVAFLYPVVCVGTMLVGMRVLNRDEATEVEAPVDHTGVG